MPTELEPLEDVAWIAAVDYVRKLANHEYESATDCLETAIATEGIGAMCNALGDACRSLMDRVTFEAGTIDVHTVVEQIAQRVIAVAGDTRPDALDHQRSLIVFLGSEGLPCAARADVATWSPIERLRALVACTIGLLGIAGEADGSEIVDLVGTLDKPGAPTPAPGTFGLAWRGGDGNLAEPLAGVVPRGYTAHITFLGSGRCSLRSIFARVAYLRDARADDASPTQLIGIPTPATQRRSS
jgi:hypothetical protein